VEWAHDILQLVRLARGRRVQFGDCAPDPLPDDQPVEIATVEHEIGSLARDDLGIDPVLLDQEICGAPDVDVENHGVVPLTTNETVRASHALHRSRFGDIGTGKSGPSL
jgi:hypothetical protein